MNDMAEENFKVLKMLESISDDLFKIKLEMRLIRIDQLNEGVGSSDYDMHEDWLLLCKDELNTKFQKMFFCCRKLSNHIFWSERDKEDIKETIDYFIKKYDLSAEDLQSLTSKIFRRKYYLINFMRKIITKDQIKPEDFIREEMKKLEIISKQLSRIEYLYNKNILEWMRETMNQMSDYFKNNKDLKGWSYKSENVSYPGRSEDELP